ncbi:MAG TPA: PIG-L deacetylase family protein [Nostocaceae cyanobacterium]|nr:PIG-L deacetylase family protein [Nostocaceae cyanobacterium]
MICLKSCLKDIQKLIPPQYLNFLQNIHSTLLSKWILKHRSLALTVSQKPVMVFSPHQDDETLGCGGMIAQKRQLGIPVTVVFLTDGQGGISLEPDKNKVIQIRKQESLSALEILGVNASDIYFLDQLDGGLGNLEYQKKQQIINQIAELIRLYEPGEIYVPHYKDCHRDHEATFKLVKLAIAQTQLNIELLQYPIWLFWRSPLFILLKLSDITPAYRLCITSVQDKKQQAIAAYSSQIQNLPSGFLQRFLNLDEIFFKTQL